MMPHDSESHVGKQTAVQVDVMSSVRGITVSTVICH